MQYRASLEALAVIDDPVSTAEALEDIALLATATGDHRRAVELVGAADAMRSDVGSVASESLEEEYGEKLAPSVEALGPEAAHEASERGRSLDEAAAITLAAGGLFEPAPTRLRTSGLRGACRHRIRCRSVLATATTRQYSTLHSTAPVCPISTAFVPEVWNVKIRRVSMPLGRPARPRGGSVDDAAPEPRQPLAGRVPASPVRLRRDLRARLDQGRARGRGAGLGGPVAGVWTGERRPAGPITVRHTAGTGGLAEFHYNATLRRHELRPGAGRTWTFNTLAGSGRATSVSTGRYSGFHAYFQVTVGLTVFITRAGNPVAVPDLRWSTAAARDCDPLPPAIAADSRTPARPTSTSRRATTYGFAMRGNN